MFEEESVPEFDIFTDLLFNSLVAFAFLFFIAFTLINPVAETGKIDTDVELLITTSWPDGSKDDVDTYVEDPAGNIVWYHEQEAGLMSLDRDDRGEYRDVILMNGVEVENPLNQEIVSVRGLVDGEYVVNIVHFLATGTDPLPVTVMVQKMNPRVEVVYYGEVQLQGRGDERTMVRFTLDGDQIGDVNDRPRSLVALTRGGKGDQAQGRPTIATDGAVVNQ